MISNIHHEKYRGEFSSSVAIACDLTYTRAAAAFYDVVLQRIVARSVIPLGEFNADNAAAEVARLVFMSMRQHGIPAACVAGIGCAAPHDLADALEEELSPTDMFLRPDTHITVLPFVSMYADSRFAAMLAAVPMKKGTLAVDFGSVLNMAYHDGEQLRLASVGLSGAFDGRGISSGMTAEFGAIDEVSRDSTSRQLCYSVVGDGDAFGIAPSAVLDSISIMLSEGIIDADGIMTDRDMFFLGEDHYITQGDVRAVQADKARSAAALECFVKLCGAPAEVYFGGEVLAINGFKRLQELGAISAELAKNAQYCRSYAEQGIFNCFTSGNKLSELESAIMNAVDVTNDIYDGFDDLYITNLSF